MNLAPGQRLAHYRLDEKIGEGGMGVVWRAVDTTLDREVAIKVLPEAFAADAGRLARFEREAKLLASLNHPGIAGVYSVHEDAGTHFLAMELVSGQDLAQRLKAGPLPLDEALETARQIAAALEAAHESGVVHRDLKPANIQLTPDGKVKVLDFGLAKMFEPETGGSGSTSLSASPTLTSAGTVAGVILGTAGYMSPEQARGKPVDRRADIWAFGAVLYEMLAGRPLFNGETVSDVPAAVLRAELDLAALPPSTPRAVERLIDRALEREPARRLQAIGEARILLEDAQAGGTEPEPEPSSATRATGGPGRLLPWAVAALAVVAAVWIGLGNRGREAPAPAPRVEASILPPPETSFDLASGGMAISDDGTRLAFPARGEDGVRRIWVRELGRGTARPVDGTEGGSGPFWSPDGRHLGFAADGLLRKVEIETGLTETLADAMYAMSGTWNETGDIIFSRGYSPLILFPSGGGNERNLTSLDAERAEDAHAWPSFLPDGRHYLFLARVGSSTAEGMVKVGSIDGGEPVALMTSNSNAYYAEPGFLIWWDDGNLKARRFDAERLELGEETRLLASGVRFDPRFGRGAFAVSPGGVLVYQRGERLQPTQLSWFDRAGNTLTTSGPPGNYYTPRLSPDGGLIAVDISDDQNNGDIWLIDVARGGAQVRLTSRPQDESVPVFSPGDGQTILFLSSVGDAGSLFEVPARGGGQARGLLEPEDFGYWPTQWLPDGRRIVTRDKDGNQDLMIYTPEEDALEDYLATPFNEWDGYVSPDGRWMAYVSNETGRRQVFVDRFPATGDRHRVSTEGGHMPMWSPEGRELLYVSAAGELTSVPVVEGERLELGSPTALFRLDVKDHTCRQYDTIDGKRFMANVNARSEELDPLTLVLGWQEPLP